MLKKKLNQLKIVTYMLKIQYTLVRPKLKTKTHI